MLKRSKTRDVDCRTESSQARVTHRCSTDSSEALRVIGSHIIAFEVPCRLFLRVSFFLRLLTFLKRACQAVLCLEQLKKCLRHLTSVSPLIYPLTPAAEFEDVKTQSRTLK